MHFVINLAINAIVIVHSVYVCVCVCMCVLLDVGKGGKELVLRQFS